MWRPKEPDEEDVSNSSGIDPGSKRRRSRRQASRDGLADQTVIKGLENVRSYRAFEHSLIGIVDPRSLLELALIHRLASLLWRLRRANAIETGLFELQSELLITHRQDPSRGASQPGPLPTAAGANGHCKRRKHWARAWDFDHDPSCRRADVDGGSWPLTGPCSRPFEPGRRTRHSHDVSLNLQCEH
jgi:hypothetical protein